MQVIVHTDTTIGRHQGLDAHVQQVMRAALQRFGEHIGRVDVHLSDGKREKSADGDNKCTVEAKVHGYQPVAVSAHGLSLHQAIDAAADKLVRALSSDLGRVYDSRRQPPPAAE
ncbi:HPF/RaiA family ribosome-associated protein [Massilia sp. TS11]|uniref:HPF/RaiA family ribosome-associated protein n=1 Tax=Massilia sp. TS11 TaxID=2908003 RepID=UPI001EDB684E|nr:HPF/RaiA family ribosome-associated protein [Massilia sp. TS11]MCG2585724.1 HPF/RaiA family ribosome-associated protein [Massilia sp. TS11]